MKTVPNEFRFLFKDEPKPGAADSRLMRMNLIDRGEYLEQGLLREDFEMLIEEELPAIARINFGDPEMEELYGLVQLGWARSLADYAMARYEPKEGKLLFNDQKAFQEAVVSKLKSLMARAAKEQK